MEIEIQILPPSWRDVTADADGDSRRSFGARSARAAEGRKLAHDRTRYRCADGNGSATV